MQVYRVLTAHTLLYPLEAAGERGGLDKQLKPHTSKQSAYSRYRQAPYWYGYTAPMRDNSPRLLMKKVSRASMRYVPKSSE